MVVEEIVDASDPQSLIVHGKNGRDFETASSSRIPGVSQNLGGSLEVTHFDTFAPAFILRVVALTRSRRFRCPF